MIIGVSNTIPENKSNVSVQSLYVTKFYCVHFLTPKTFIRNYKQLVQNKCKHSTANIIQYQLVTELDDAQTLVMQPNKSNDLPH